jgi:ATP adenylyltransferase
LVKNKTKDFNPFLPYEEELFVTKLGKNHVCLLNKFNVVDHHILMITKGFESQENWLTYEDFSALLICLQEIDGLAFYNGGKAAGASQPHKHLQLIPFAEAIALEHLPIAALLKQIDWSQTQPQLPGFDVPHAIAPIEKLEEGAFYQTYQLLLSRLKLITSPLIAGQQTHPYNLLVTRQWMMIIPRQQESFQSISVNSLGFAGALLVRDRPQLDLLKKITPLKLLQAVTRHE